MIPLVDVKAQYAPLIPELKERFAEVLESGLFILGPNVKAFEEEAAAYLGVPQTIGVANGTDALVLVLDAMGIGPGDEVICPAFTFYATAEAIARRGATPVFADIDPATLNLDPEDVAARITPRTKAIMPVHLFGRPAPLAELAALGLPIIEDAAQAFGVAGDRDAPASPRPSASTRRRTCSRSATAGSSRSPTTSSASASACSASTARATRRTSSSSATTRASTRSRPRSLRVFLRAPRRVDAAAPRGCGALPRARPRRARRDAPRTSPATSTTCSSAARPSATASVAALARGGDRLARRTTCRRSTSSRRCASSATSEGVLPETEQASRARTSRVPLWAGIPPTTQERVVDAVRAAVARRASRDPGQPAPALAARSPTRPSSRSPGGSRSSSASTQGVPVYYETLFGRTIAIVVAIKLAVFVLLRLLQPLVALRLDAGHVADRRAASRSPRCSPT